MRNFIVQGADLGILGALISVQLLNLEIHIFDWEVKAIVKKDGDKFISEQTAKKADQKSTRTTREFFEDKVVQTMEVLGTDVVCVQTFTRKKA